ncbi:thiol reductant ABC exporter subunit CydC [Pseudactinotalea suaedae]|uniref:thiol reductant ABC exporter subunit CydC n=1 Tax=Pseudactinotalea suaedae TaxID=1524924 RepID=UPI0012E310DE|nr:thiol reductant ABC exporter subunit CydC [Pseudactinotalea suaedae]
MTAGTRSVAPARPGLREDVEALRTIWPLLGVSRGRLLLAAVWGSLTLGAAVGLAAVSAWLIARASQMPAVLDLTVAVVAVRALGIGRGVFRYLDRLTSHDVALRGSATLRERLYRALAAGRLDAVATLRRGEVLRRWGADVDDVGDLVVRAVVPALVAVVVSAGAVAIVGALSPAIGVALGLCLLVAGAAAPALSARAVRQAELAGAAARGEVSASVMTVLDGASELTVNGRLDGVLEGLRRAEGHVRDSRDRAARPAALAQGVTVGAMGVAVVLALVVGASQLAAGVLTPVELAVVVLTPLAAFEGVGALAPAAVHTVRAADAARRIGDLLERADHPGRGGGRPDRSGALVAHDLAVGWPGQEPLLRGVDLTLAPGRAVAVIGANGSGKTTLLLTLAGLLPPASGQVLVGGVPSTDLAEGAAATVATMTSEDAHVFDTTLLENLRVARGDVSRDEAAAALRQAGLGAFLAGLATGLDTPVGENGTLISGGERRRLLIARALLTRAPLLLLDEPDEHLDPATADALLADVLALREAGRGVVVVTHRRSERLVGADTVIDLSAAGR